MADWTAPRTWVDKELIPYTTFNTHVRDNLIYLHDQGGSSQPHTTAQQIGTFHGTTPGDGIALSSTVTGALKVFADDADLAIGSGVLARSVWGRLLMGYAGDQQCEAFGVQGNVVWSTSNPIHNDGGVLGSWEARGTVITKGTVLDNIHAGVVGRVGAGSGVTLTISSNSVLAGLAAMSNVNDGASFTKNGIFTGIYVGRWTDAVDWDYGIYMDRPAAIAHIRIGGTALISSDKQAILIYCPSETAAVNGIWVTLGSTVTSGDLTGIRTRVTGNAASSGANVRGAYLEAKVGAGKYAAMLEGALIHADYSAIGAGTISGDVRGLTVHISQGTGLTAANLYGILLNIQTRGNESITTDDVGLMIRNQAVGGNGRTMDAALKIAGLNMGGGTNPFMIGIDFTGIICTTAEIDLDFGKIIFDSDGDTDIHSDVDNELDFKLSGSNFVIMAAGVMRPDITNQVDLGSSSKQFKDIYVDGVGYIDTMAGFILTGNITMPDSGRIVSSGVAGGDLIYLHGGTAAAGSGGVFRLTSNAVVNQLRWYTSNVAGDTDVLRMSLAGSAAIATMTLTNITWTGLVLSGALTLNSQAFDAGSGVARVNTTGNFILDLYATNDAANGPIVRGYHTSTTPAASDNILSFYANGYDLDSPQNAVLYGRFAIMIEDATADHADGMFAMYLLRDQTDTLAMTVTSLGAVGGDAAYAEFDSFNGKPLDDVKLMVRSAIPQLCDIGVMSKKPIGQEGYMLNFQNAIYLAWGGIKQNRAMLDNMAVSIVDLEHTMDIRFEPVNEKIERLEGELAELKASLN